MTESVTQVDAITRQSTGEPVLAVEGLVRRFGDRVAVDDVSFTVAAGETYGLLGPNGAGKSTTIAMIAGLLTPQAGTVTVAGTSIRPRSTAGRGAIGLVPQELAIYPDLSAAENLDVFGRLQAMSGRDLKARIAEVLEVIGLTDRAGERTETYSGGMQRRLNIGIGLLHRPRLLVLDEPTVGVDPQSRNAILEAVEALTDEGLAVLYTTHYMEEAERLCDRVGIIDEGRLLAEGPPGVLARGDDGRDVLAVGVTGRAEVGLDAVAAVEGTTEVTVDGNTLRVVVDDGPRRVGAVVEALDATALTVTSIEVDRPDLESLFLRLTGKALRD